MQVSPEKLSTFGREHGSTNSRRPRHSVVASSTVVNVIFRDPPFKPIGPRSMKTRLLWAHRLWTRLSPREKDTLIFNMTNLWPESAFTGLGSFQQILAMITTAINVHLHTPLPVPREHVSIEIDPKRQDRLRSLPKQYRPHHLCGDIQSRWHPTLAADVAQLVPDADAAHASKALANQKIKDKILEHVDDNPLSAVRHGSCVMHPGMDCYDEFGTLDNVSIRVAGCPAQMTVL